jgi:hypothetical protein
MKYVCLGYIDERHWDKVPERERNATMDQCFTYDDELRRGGHFAGGEALQGRDSAVTLRFRDGAVSVTDGPYAETKEQFGGFHIVECRDVDEALAIAERIPTLRVGGTVEVRPVEPRI